MVNPNPLPQTKPGLANQSVGRRFPLAAFLLFPSILLFSGIMTGVGSGAGVLGISCSQGGGATGVTGGTAKVPPRLERRASDALECAIALAEHVDNPEFQSNLQQQLVECQISMGWLAPAAELGSSISGYRRGIALAKVAAAYGRKGEGAKMEPLLEDALATEGFPHSWQGEAIRAEVAIAWAAGEDLDRSTQAIKELTDPAALVRAQSGVAVEQARRGGEYDESVFVADETGRLNPHRLSAARALIEISLTKLAGAEASSQVRNDLLALGQRAEAILRASRAAAGEEYLDLGILYRKLGEKARSAEMLGLGMRQMPPGAELHSWRPGYFARLIGVYFEGGREEEVETMLSSARESSRSLFRFYQAPALCQIAEAQLVAGKPDAARETWIEAAKIAIAADEVTKYLGTAQVAVSVARAGEMLGEELRALLDPLLPHASAGSDSADK